MACIAFALPPSMTTLYILHQSPRTINLNYIPLIHLLSLDRLSTCEYSDRRGPHRPQPSSQSYDSPYSLLGNAFTPHTQPRCPSPSTSHTPGLRQTRGSLSRTLILRPNTRRAYHATPQCSPPGIDLGRLCRATRSFSHTPRHRACAKHRSAAYTHSWRRSPKSPSVYRCEGMGPRGEVSLPRPSRTCPRRC